MTESRSIFVIHNRGEPDLDWSPWADRASAERYVDEEIRGDRHFPDYEPSVVEYAPVERHPGSEPPDNNPAPKEQPYTAVVLHVSGRPDAEAELERMGFTKRTLWVREQYGEKWRIESEIMRSGTAASFCVSSCWGMGPE